jgi:hypothetical protein
VGLFAHGQKGIIAAHETRTPAWRAAAPERLEIRTMAGILSEFI